MLVANVDWYFFGIENLRFTLEFDSEIGLV